MPYNRLIKNRSPYAIIALAIAVSAFCAFAAAQQAQADPVTLKLYKTHCQSCHMPNGNARSRPLNLQDSEWKHGNSPREIAAIIRNGVKGTAMRPFKEKLKPVEIDALANYVRAFEKPSPPTETKK